MKIAIVGAGICGLYLGWKLAERGNQVTIFEKKEKIGKEVCSGLFSERILDFIPESQKSIQNQIDFVLIHFPRKTLKIKFFNPVGNRRFSFGARKFLVMNRFKLDNLVAELAENSGAKIILNHNVSKSDFDTIQEGFERIIGCDGPNSIIRKSLGLPNPTYRLAIQGFLKKEDHSDFVETWPTKSGFIWKIPRGKEVEEDKSSSPPFANARVIEYGIISDPKGAKLLFDNFLEKNNLSLEKINSAIVPRDLIIPSNQKITLCGDAAGLTKPWSGGGVVWSLIAANLLLKNFPDFLKYKKAVKKFFLPKIIFSKIAIKTVYFLGFKIPWLFPRNIKIESDFLSRRI